MSICSHRSTFSAAVATFALAAPAAAQDGGSPYDRAVAAERASHSGEGSFEDIASGAAAVVIGIYGYYNTSPNPVIKMLYAATQTAGVLTFGQGIRNRNAPSLMLEMDELLRQASDGRSIRADDLRTRLVAFKAKSDAADARTLAYTSSILAALYFYNGFREMGPDKTLRNVYYFLGFNFAVGGGVGFYRAYYQGDWNGGGLSLRILPLPTVAYSF